MINRIRCWLGRHEFVSIWGEDLHDEVDGFRPTIIEYCGRNCGFIQCWTWHMIDGKIAQIPCTLTTA